MPTLVATAGVAPPNTASSSRCNLSKTASGLAASVLFGAVNQTHSTSRETGLRPTSEQECAAAARFGPRTISREWCSWRMAAHGRTSASWIGRNCSWFEAVVGGGGCPGLWLPLFEICVASWPEVPWSVMGSRITVVFELRVNAPRMIRTGWSSEE